MGSSDSDRTNSSNDEDQNVPGAASPSDRARLAAIIARLQQDDPTALRDLADLYAVQLGAISISITASPDLAQDVFQDVLVKVWDYRAELHTVSDVTAFLRQLTRRRAIDVFRHEQAQRRLGERVALDRDPDAMMVTNPSVQEMDAADLRAAVLVVLDTVPPQCRTVFLMHSEGGMSYAEIADTLGITTKTVRNQVYRAFRALAEHFTRNPLP